MITLEEEILSPEEKSNKQVAVLIAAYNSEQTIRDTIESLFLNECKFDIFIVDDNSLVPISGIINGENIFITRNKSNIGLAASLNVGIKIIIKRGYKYIARMDADDLCLPGRIDKQFKFMEENRNIGLVGCWERFFDSDTGRTLMYFRPPVEHEDICKMLYFNSPIAHPTWMLRSDVVCKTGVYNEKFRSGQDYELLSRIVRYTRVSNIPDVMVDYRVSDTAISQKSRKNQLFSRLSVQKKMFSPTQWRSYAGIMKTVILLAIPMDLTNYVKRAILAGDKAKL